MTTTIVLGVVFLLFLTAWAVKRSGRQAEINRLADASVEAARLILEPLEVDESTPVQATAQALLAVLKDVPARVLVLEEDVRHLKSLVQESR